MIHSTLEMFSEDQERTTLFRSAPLSPVVKSEISRELKKSKILQINQNVGGIFCDWRQREFLTYANLTTSLVLKGIPRQIKKYIVVTGSTFDYKES